MYLETSLWIIIILFAVGLIYLVYREYKYKPKFLSRWYIGLYALIVLLQILTLSIE